MQKAGLLEALTVVMNLASGLIAARLNRYGPRPTANIATSLLARGEFALILAAMATAAGLDGRLSSFTAGYVLALAVLGPVMASRVNWLVRARPHHGVSEPAPSPSGATIGRCHNDLKA